jgi:hypothetical protein
MEFDPINPFGAPSPQDMVEPLNNNMGLPPINGMSNAPVRPLDTSNNFIIADNDNES